MPSLTSLLTYKTPPYNTSTKGRSLVLEGHHTYLVCSWSKPNWTRELLNQVGWTSIGHEEICEKRSLSSIELSRAEGRAEDRAEYQVQSADW
ncbi:unnamed protein product [Microthlaspi erraticum]|uniref:Uncharacterized protein n=1 Tax=Microthlaspi erraticum TaxID=1685480 RepID=A0A6D2JUY0_9BRAS|nr:unnamed protein product [Microthlaspi erraticum]